MKLPNFEQAVVTRAKIAHYLLDLSSENGAPKARFFMAFGFTIERWEELADALRRHGADHDVAHVERRPQFGIHYVVEGALVTPDGRDPGVRSIWAIDDGDTIPRLISAYPL